MRDETQDAKTRQQQDTNALLEVAELHDAAGLASRFRTVDLPWISTCGGAVPSFEAAHITPEALHEQFVLHNRPAVLRALQDWRPLSHWNDAHIRALCGERTISVRLVDEARQFGDPKRQGMYTHASLSLGSFIDALEAAEARGQPAPYYAAQLSLRRDLPELFADTRPEPPHLHALGALWRGSPHLYIGGSSQTPLHFDAFDNLLCVVRGRKTLLLWHPGCAELLYPGGGGSALFSQADVFAPDLRAFPLLERALLLALHVDLGPGDALYLPCGWWHAVQSQPPAQGHQRSISLSYWARQSGGKVRDSSEGGAAFHV